MGQGQLRHQLLHSIYDRLFCWKYKCTLRQTASDKTIIWTVDKVHKQK